MSKNVGSHKYFGPVLFGKLDAFPHLFERKVVRIRTKTVLLAADIYRIRTVMDGKF